MKLETKSKPEIEKIEKSKYRKMSSKVCPSSDGLVTTRAGANYHFGATSNQSHPSYSHYSTKALISFYNFDFKYWILTNVSTCWWNKRIFPACRKVFLASGRACQKFVPANCTICSQIWFVPCIDLNGCLDAIDI